MFPFGIFREAVQDLMDGGEDEGQFEYELDNEDEHDAMPANFDRWCENLDEYIKVFKRTQVLNPAEKQTIQRIYSEVSGLVTQFEDEQAAGRMMGLDGLAYLIYYGMNQTCGCDGSPSSSGDTIPESKKVSDCIINPIYLNRMIGIN
jgi:hypothetical protein